MVQAVLFDLDDTLFDHRHCARCALAGVRTMHAALAGVDPAAFEAAHSRILEVLHLEVMAGRLDLDAARVERFRRLFACAGVDADDAAAARAAAAYRAEYLAARREVAGAASLLAALRGQCPAPDRRTRIVVVSNNLLEEQRQKLRHCGLERYVDVLVVSEEAGAAKPDPGIFEVALRRAEVAADAAVMVGDSWINDVEGARAAGIRAIWFQPEDQAAPDPEVPVIRSLEPAVEVASRILGWGVSRDPSGPP